MANKKGKNDITEVDFSKAVTEKTEESPRKIIFHNPLSPGDILVMSAAIRDLHLKYPNKFITGVDTPCNQLFENNPYITWDLDRNAPDVEFMRLDYDIIHNSNQAMYHFIHGYHFDLEKKLGVSLPEIHYKEDGGVNHDYRAFKPHIVLSDDEKSWMSQISEITGKDTPFWIVVNGGKYDFTAKWWDPHRMQKVVENFPDVTFVQVGQKDHFHPELKGDNIINLVGKTDLRQMVRLMYHADGCICPVTFLMHLSAAVETKGGRPLERPCIVMGGGREPQQWEGYPSHRYLSTTGCLPCCDRGGCWKSRVEPLGDRDEKDENLCERPITTPEGVTIPQCMDMITAGDVSRELSKYLAFYQEYDKSRYIPKKKEPMKAEPKVGRNTKCPCGSGKKYKFCCGK
jgi:ADP-heptose:LPS heptosyltransferase